MSTGCFVCEELIVDGYKAICIYVYSDNPARHLYFHNECFELDSLSFYKISSEVGTTKSLCSLCNLKIIVLPFYNKEISELPKVFADIWYKQSYYRICKDCWYRDIDISLVIESGA